MEAGQHSSQPSVAWPSFLCIEIEEINNGVTAVSSGTGSARKAEKRRKKEGEDENIVSKA